MFPSARKYFASEGLAQRKRNYGAPVFVQIDIGLIVRVSDLWHQQPARPQHVVHTQANIGLFVAAGEEKDPGVAVLHAPALAPQPPPNRTAARRLLTAPPRAPAPATHR